MICAFARSISSIQSKSHGEAMRHGSMVLLFLFETHTAVKQSEKEQWWFSVLFNTTHTRMLSDVDKARCRGVG
jgi:hypothetical protein